MDAIHTTLGFVNCGMAALDAAIFIAGTLLVRKDIKALAGWSFFCAYAFFEICANAWWGTLIFHHALSQGANTNFQLYGMLNLASHFFLALFCHQLNRAVSRKFISIFTIIAFAITGLSEYAVAYGGWHDQFIPIPIARQIPLALICIYIAYELLTNLWKEFTFGLGGLALTITLKLILGAIRIAYLATVETPILDLDSLSPSMSALAFFRSSLSAAPLAFIFGYWVEDLLNSRKKVQLENNQIKALLNEKTMLLDAMADFSRAAEAGGLTAALTHEISQPISAVTLKATLLKAQFESTYTHPEMQTLIDGVLFETARASQSVHHLRQIFQPVAQGRQDAVGLIDPKIVSDQILSIVASRAKQSKVMISVENSNPHQVLVRADDFYTLTLNFVLNALDALEECEHTEKKIRIYLVSTLSALTLIVDDNGPGIPPAFVDQVFSLRKTTKAHGMGVGLWLCQQLCRNRGYSISFNSAAGEGTEFKVLFPAESTPLGATPGSAVASRRPS